MTLMPETLDGNFRNEILSLPEMLNIDKEVQLASFPLLDKNSLRNTGAKGARDKGRERSHIFGNKASALEFR